MSLNHDPFDADATLASCACGFHRDQNAHDAVARHETTEQLNCQPIETAVVRALFPREGERRRFLKAVGVSTAAAAISSLFPFSALEAMAQEKGPLEKKDLKIGFVAITCATPLIMAGPTF